MEKLTKYAAIPAAVLLPAVSFAQTATATADPASVFSTTVATITANVGTFGLALVGVAAVGVAFMVAIKFVKRISGAA